MSLLADAHGEILLREVHQYIRWRTWEEGLDFTRMAKSHKPSLAKRGHNNPPEPTEGYLVGYARVSTPDQSLQMQIDALKKVGVLDDNVHTDVASGVKDKRPGLENALKDCRPGDTFVAWKLDRVGRSLLHLITLFTDLENRGIKFRSLTEGIDTGTPGGRLIMHVMASLAQFERDLIVERTKAGIRAKIARGEKHGLGQRFKRPEAEALFRQGLDGVQVAKRLKVSKSAIYHAYPRDVREALMAEATVKKLKRK